MSNDKSMPSKHWKAVVGIIILFLVGLYLYMQLETDPVYTPANYPIQRAADRNNELFEMQQEQYRKDAAARDRDFENWHQTFVED
jgi:hypothetical protein